MSDPPLEEILRSPEDDALRLRAADRLEAAGEAARAEFIRLQCRRESLHPASAEARRSTQRERELLDAHRERWCEDFEAKRLRLRFRRGFGHRLVVDWTVAPEDLQWAMRQAPIEELEIDEGEEVDEEVRQPLLACDELRRIRLLELDEDWMSPEEWCRLLSAPAWSSLETVIVGDHSAEAAIARAVLDAGLAGLRHLDFHGYLAASLGKEGAKVIAGHEGSAALTRLRLLNCALDAEGARALADSSQLGRLEELHLGGGNYTRNDIGREGAIALAQGDGMPELQRLVLDFNHIGDAGLEAIARSRSWRRLRRVSLQANELGPDSFKHLMVSEVIDSIETLDLSHNQLDARACECLALNRPPRLQNLWLYGNPVGDKGARILARSPTASQLVELNLARTGLGDEGARELLELASSPVLERLWLGLNELSPAIEAELQARFGDRLLSV